MAPRRTQKTGQIAFGLLRLLPSRKGSPLGGMFALEQSIQPGTLVERFGREWRMAKYIESDGFIFGRIGFQGAGAAEEVWNDKAQDFHVEQQKMGSTSPFAIRLTDNDFEYPVAYQLRPGRIKATTFTGNFQALLNEASRPLRWRMLPLVSGVSWEEWTHEVLRITELTIKVREPNPTYRRESIEGFDRERQSQNGSFGVQR